MYTILDQSIVKEILKEFKDKGIEWIDKTHRIGITLFENNTWELSVHTVNTIEIYTYDKNRWVLIESIASF